MKKAKEEEKFQNLELTVYQKIALRGEVAIAYETSMHQEDMEFNTYILLFSANATPQYIPFYKEEMLKYVDEETFNKAYRYVLQGMFPKTFAIKKIVADLKVYAGSQECIKDKVPKVPEPILASKFVSYMRTILSIAPVFGKDILRLIISDESEKLDFVKEVCFTMLMETENHPDYITEPMSFVKLLQPRIIDTMSISFHGETDRLNSDSPLVNVTEESDEPIATVAPTLYTVEKVDIATGVVVMTRKFDSLKLAKEYLDSIRKDYPDLFGKDSRYKFKIV